MKKIWFVRKRYGWGWTPVTWQGWVAIAVYVLCMFFIFRDVDHRSHSTSDTLIKFALPYIFFTSALIVLCYKKGERPKWQWGKDSK